MNRGRRWGFNNRFTLLFTGILKSSRSQSANLNHFCSEPQSLLLRTSITSAQNLIHFCSEVYVVSIGSSRIWTSGWQAQVLAQSHQEGRNIWSLTIYVIYKYTLNVVLDNKDMSLGLHVNVSLESVIRLIGDKAFKLWRFTRKTLIVGKTAVELFK